MTKPLLYTLAAVVALGVAFAAGRYSKPAEVVTHTEYVDRLQVVKTTVVQRVVDTQTKWRRVVVTQPDGTTRSEETADTHTHVDEHTNENENSSKTSEAKAESKTTSKTSNWTIFVSAGFQLPNGRFDSFGKDLSVQPVYGITVGRRLLGPIWTQAQANTSGTFSLGLGLEF